MVAIWISRSRSFGGGVERHLCTEDGAKADSPSCRGEPHHTVETPVVGQSEPRETEGSCSGDELLRVRCAVEEAEARVAVELSVRSHQS